MPVQVQGPDGNTYQFPDGTDKAGAIAYFKKKGIGVKAADPAPRSAIKPEDRTVGNYASETVRGVGRGLKNDVMGLYETVRHPKKTVADMAQQLSEAQRASEREYNDLQGQGEVTRNIASMLAFAENAPIIGGMVQHAEQGGTKPGSPESVGAAAEGITTLEAPKVAAGAIALAPRAARAVTGTGPRAMRDLVKDTRKLNGQDAEGVAEYNAKEVAKAAEANRVAAEKHLNDTQEALHETRGRELKHERDVKAAKDAAAEANRVAAEKHLSETLDALHQTQGNELAHQQALKAAQAAAQEAQRALDAEHSEAVQKSLQETREREDLYQQELSKAKAEGADAYRKKLAEVEQKRAKAEQAYRQEIRQYLAKKHKLQSDWAAAQEKFKGDSAKQGKIAPTQDKLTKAGRELQAQIETARNNALKEGNSKYTAVNEKLNPMPADMEAIHGLYYEAAESIGEAQAEPALLKRLGTSLQNSGELTYRDLQSLYSELGKELSKGSLPGTTYHAYDLLHEGIGKDMQRIADAQGQGAQLTAARNYWRRMKQAFGKPYNPTDAANVTLEKATGQGAVEEQANRVRLLGSFDPSIPQTVEHIGNIRKGLEALPNTTSEQARLRGLVDARKPLGPAPRRPEAIPNPEPTLTKEVSPPARVEIPDRPEQVQPKMPKQPERVPVPDRPGTVEAKMPDPYERVAPPDRPKEILPGPKRLAVPKKIGPQEVQAAKAESLQKRTDLVRHKALWIAAGPPIYALVDLLRGEIPNVGKVAGVSAGIGTLGIAIDRVMENPKVVDFLTKATERDVAAIPEDLRGDFPQIVQQAQKRGIKVSPALLAVPAALAPRQHPTDAWQGIQP